jgi:ParB/RepB/Spo0J family partition protein
MMQEQDYQVEMIDPRLLKPHPDNPRMEIDEDDQEFIGFADNIKANGVIQPIIGTKVDGDMLILAGHRRTRAAIARELPAVPVIFRIINPGQYPEDFFISENDQRNDLSPLEDARALANLRQRIADETGREPAKGDLCRRLNIPLAQINQRLAILELSPRIQLLFHRLELPMSSSLHLIKLLNYPDEVEAMADRLLTRQVTGNSLATLVQRRLDDLDALREAETEGKRDGRRHGRSHYGPTRNYATDSRDPAITRAVAVENLRDKSRNKISLFDIGVVLENVCCHCGMMGNETVCGTCPLPKLINGIVGRSNQN